MIFGLSVFTFSHVLVSLLGITSGLVVTYGLLISKRFDGWTIFFLGTTAATSLTGFLFPYHGFTPAIGTGILSMVVLIMASVALYWFHLTGIWRSIYVATAVTAFYLNVFVFIVQAFQKIAVLKALAPTQSEPPFLIAQGAALLVFIAVGFGAARRFHPVTRA